MASHLQKVHHKGSDVTFAARGTVCQVCLVDYRSMRRLRSHLYRVAQCRRAYIAVDFSAAEKGDDGPVRAWLPPVRVQGPRPFWATLRPDVEDDAPIGMLDMTTVIARHAASFQPLPKGRELAGRFQKLLRSVSCNEAGVQQALDAAEDLPITTPGLCFTIDLLLVIEAMQGSVIGSFSGSFISATWREQRLLLGEVPSDMKAVLLSG